MSAQVELIVATNQRVADYEAGRLSVEDLIKQTPRITVDMGLASFSHAEFAASSYALVRTAEAVGNKIRPEDVTPDSEVDGLIQDALALEGELNRRVRMASDLPVETETDELLKFFLEKLLAENYWRVNGFLKGIKHYQIR